MVKFRDIVSESNWLTSSPSFAYNLSALVFIQVNINDVGKESRGIFKNETNDQTNKWGIILSSRQQQPAIRSYRAFVIFIISP